MNRQKQFGIFLDDGVAHLMTESTLFNWAVSTAFCNFNTVNGKVRPTSKWDRTSAKLHVPWNIVPRVTADKAQKVFGKCDELDTTGMSIYG